MRRLVTTVLIVLVLMSQHGISEPARGQSDEVVALYDYSGDGDVTCRDDFRIEFPQTFTEEATAALSRFPEELNSLDRDDDGIACEDGEGSGDEPTPTAVAVTPEPRSDRPTPTPPSDLPPRPSPVTNTTGCDSTLVENGRVTVCAGQFIEVRPFDFDAFAASAQDGFGHFSGSGTSGPVSIGVPSSSPATGSSGTSTSQQPAGEGGSRLRTSEQSAQKVRKQKRKKAKAKAKKGKRDKDGKRHRDRERRRGATHRAR